MAALFPVIPSSRYILIIINNSLLADVVSSAKSAFD